MFGMDGTGAQSRVRRTDIRHTSGYIRRFPDLGRPSKPNYLNTLPIDIIMSLERFMKVYSNIPINLRKEIILVIDDQPITWNVAYLEIKNNTPLGKRILEKLSELEII